MVFEEFQTKVAHFCLYLARTKMFAHIEKKEGGTKNGHETSKGSKGILCLQSGLFEAFTLLL